MIEVLFAVRKDKFKANLAIQPDLDLVDENDQYTHMLTLDDPCEPESMLGKRNCKSNLLFYYFLLQMYLNMMIDMKKMKKNIKKVVGQFLMN